MGKEAMGLVARRAMRARLAAIVVRGVAFPKFVGRAGLTRTVKPITTAKPPITPMVRPLITPMFMVRVHTATPVPAAAPQIFHACPGQPK
jgi:hypothetical protein